MSHPETQRKIESKSTRQIGFRVKAIILLLLSILGFVWVTAYGSLRQSTDQVARLSDAALPALTSTMTLANVLQEVILNSERLSNANAQAERRLAYEETVQSIQAARMYLADFEIVGGQGDIEAILTTLSTTATDLDNLIDGKLDAATRFEAKRDTFLVWAEALTPTLTRVPPEHADWYQALAPVVFKATGLSTSTNARTLRREMLQINRSMRDLRRGTSTLPADRQTRAQQTLSAIEAQILGNDGLFTYLQQYSQLDLRAKAISRQMRLISSEMVRELNALTSSEITQAQAATVDLTVRSERNIKLLVLAVVIAIAISLASFFYIDRKLVRRLVSLKTAVNQRADGVSVPIPLSGRDEITEISGAVRYFVEEIDRRQKELRASAEQIRAIVLHSPQPMCIATKDQILFYNDAFEELWPGTQTSDEILRHLPAFLLTISEETLSSRRHSINVDGERWFDLVSSPADWEGVQARQLILVEVTSQIQVEKTLEEARDKAEAAAKAKTSFLAMMSHEIRSPMNGIISVAELLSQGELSTEQQQLVGVINQSAETLLTVINDILDFSKIEAGKLAINKFDFNLGTVLKLPAELLGAEFDRKGVDLRFELAENLPTFIHTDANRLRQILFNLIGNAAKFTEHGHVTVRADRSYHEGSHWLTIAIVDTGIGISKKHMERLFQPFEQADSSTARQYGGTGLGLSICKKLAEMLGGDLTVESTIGAGSTFRLAIPFDLPKDIASMAKEESTAPADHHQQAENHILVVEDNPINQLVIGKVLKQLSCSFDMAEDGQVALEKMADTRYDLILTDLRMPRMDGFALARAVRSQEGDGETRMPIIAVSADAMEEARIESEESGIDAFITKPVRLEEIRKCLTTYTSQ